MIILAERIIDRYPLINGISPTTKGIVAGLWDKTNAHKTLAQPVLNKTG